VVFHLVNQAFSILEIEITAKN
jgi:hypothetical protein